MGEIQVTEKPEIAGPNGERLSIAASAGPERQPLTPAQDPTIVDYVLTPKLGLFNPVKQHGCGHLGPSYYNIRVYGGIITPTKEHAQELCPDCLIKEVKETFVRCCLCGLYIMPGDPVAVYCANSVEPKDFAFTIVGSSAIGCLRWDCCQSGGFYAGNWTGKDIDPSNLERSLS